MRSWRKVGCCYLGRADSGLPTYLRPRVPLLPNDDGHCPRDRVRRVDSSFCVFSLGEGGGELSTPPDRMYSLNSLGSGLSAPSLLRVLFGERFPGRWVLTKAGDRSCLCTVCMTRVVESIR